MRFLYNICIKSLIFAIRIGAKLGQKKLRKGLAGRRNQELLYQKIAQNRQEDQGKMRLLWLHAASLGEYEQARSLLEVIHREYPNYQILLTFFSPSGYEHAKIPTYVQYVGYIPFDLPNLVKDFLEKTQPDLVIFVKYELWWNCLQLCKARQIPIILIAAITHKNQHIGYFKKQALLQFSYIFTQNAETKAIFAQFYPEKQLFIAGDPRVERILQLSYQNPTELAWLPKFKRDKLLFIAGSLEKSDFPLLAKCQKILSRDFQSILVPHEIHSATIAFLQKLFPESCLLSEIPEISPEKLGQISCIIVNSIGQLNTLYAYTQICYIGGAWKKHKLHNILEPIGRGNLVITGPKIHNFKEAQDLHNLKYIKVLQNRSEMVGLLQNILKNPAEYLQLGKLAEQYLREIPPSCPEILRIMQEKKLLQK